MRVILFAAAVLIACASLAEARFAMVPADRVDEVPVARLLANIERNEQGLSPAQKARAIGRLHLIAYLRQTEKLMAYRKHHEWRDSQVAEGRIDDCTVLDPKAATDIGMPPDYFPKGKRGQLCEETTYGFGPRPEVPRPHRKPPPNVHLTAAIAAYEQARRLEPDNLRTRLALAYAYDCAGRLEEARNELRFAARRGLKLLEVVPEPMRATNNGRERTYPVEPPQGMIEWETHFVLSEVVSHFSEIAVRGDDKQLVATLRRRLEGIRPARMVTPILVPLVADVDFAAFVDRASDVAFDFSGQGEKMQLGWLTDKAAWLVWDPRGSGRIDSGFQMFGSVTWIAFWENGYLPLGSLDDDGDGKLAGAELRGLALWRDADGDGVSDVGEVKPLIAYRIVALRYGYERAGDDMWIAKRGVEFADGEVRPTYDWLLHEARVQSVSR